MLAIERHHRVWAGSTVTDRITEREMVSKYGQYWDKSKKTMISGGEGSSRGKMLSNKEKDLGAANMYSLTAQIATWEGKVKSRPLSGPGHFKLMSSSSILTAAGNDERLLNKVAI